MRVQLRALFRTLSTDDTPMVRRAAASSLGKFGAAVEPDNLAKDLLPQFQALSMDGAPLSCAPQLRVLRQQSCPLLCPDVELP